MPMKHIRIAKWKNPTSWDETHEVVDNLVLPKTSGNGIQVDTQTPTFPWADMLGSIVVQGIAGGNTPTWATYRSGLKQWQFTVNDEVWTSFHLPHDYLPGSDVYIHAHWSYIAASMTSGSVTWAFETTVAKGHQQQAFTAPITASAQQTAVVSGSGGQYMHHIAEVQLSSTAPDANQINNSSIEPDSVIIVRTYLSANALQGTPEPFLHFVDMHYQSTGIGTKQKSPSFYS